MKAFQDAIDKYSNSKEFEQNWLAGEEQKKSYIQRIIPEIERLRNDAAEILDPTYKVSGEQGIENINTVSDEARTKYLQYHPDVFAGLDKDHTTYENAMIACKACGLALEHVVNKEPRLVDYNLCMEAVKSNGYALKDGDIISVRGKGKFQFGTVTNKTKKDRYHVVLYKYC